MKFDIATFRSVLIANRGEIASRLIRTAKNCGLKVIVVYTHADKDSPYVKLADQAILIGDGPVTESYLSITKIINAALSSKAEAIHPGYGFLSENAEFAVACEKNNIIFIGPKPHSIKIMGNKTEAKKIVSSAGIPCIPGSDLIVKTQNEISSVANKVGYPLMIKAAAGGGGKGMRLVNHENDLHSALKLAKAEGLNSFGSDEVILERAMISARHVEIQIFGDNYGNVIHLGERDCSVQRRHQKLIDESPSPVLTDEIRKDLFDRTVNMVSKIGYEGAGTVEFIYEAGKFYFLEMNTRIQVEHPVTEMVTGIDIIKEQIWIAYTGETALKQSDISPRGHAIECRINAEDASKNFQPSPGTIGMCHQPSGFRTRVDGSIFQGYKVTPYYDSMICKLIVQGRNRTEAIQRMNRSLDEFIIDGITTTIPLHKKLLSHKKFINSDFNVSWLDKEKII
jgi:acetyl-CoA carboxylase biotin carboxylase subunit